MATIAFAAVPSTMIKLLKACGNFQEHHWLTPEVEGANAVPVYGLGSSALSRRIFLADNVQKTIHIRRANYAHWLKRINNHSKLTALIDKLPQGCCPLYFPIIVSNPAIYVTALAQADIEAFNWWQHMPEEILALGVEQFPIACQLKKCIIALPVHQCVTPRQIDRMADVLSQVVT